MTVFVDLEADFGREGEERGLRLGVGFCGVEFEAGRARREEDFFTHVEGGGKIENGSAIEG